MIDARLFEGQIPDGHELCTSCCTFIYERKARIKSCPACRGVAAIPDVPDSVWGEYKNELRKIKNDLKCFLGVSYHTASKLTFPKLRMRVDMRLKGYEGSAPEVDLDMGENDTKRLLAGMLAMRIKTIKSARSEEGYNLQLKALHVLMLLERQEISVDVAIDDLRRILSSQGDTEASQAPIPR